MTTDKVKSSFPFDPQSHVRPFLASTTALLSLVMATSMVMQATPARADPDPIENCTVTDGNGTASAPEHGSTITCISGTYSGIIGSDTVNDLTVKVEAGATLNGNDSSAIRADQWLNLTNYGTITKYSHYTNPNYDPTISVFAPSTINNFGTIQNSGYGTAISIGSSYVPPTENHSGYYHSSQTANDGTIIGGTSSVAIQGSSGSDRLTNRGTIRRQDNSTTDTVIDLGDGHDQVILEAGSRITGKIDGGSGPDTLTLGGDTNENINFGTSPLSGFEYFSKTGSSTWTIYGSPGSFSNGIGISAGTLRLGEADILGDGDYVGVWGGALDLQGFNETIGSFTLFNSALNGTGTLSAGTYTLYGGTVNANLGAGVLTQDFGITTLNGTSNAHTVNVYSGTLALGADDRLADAATVTVFAGALNLGEYSDTVGNFALGGGTLNGTGTLTSTTYTLYGGTVNANLGDGTLIQHSGTTNLNGASNASEVNIINGGALNLGADERLNDTAAVTVSSGTLNLAGKTETIGTLQGGGQVSLGGGALTVGNGDGSSTFDGAISGAGSLTKAGSGTFILNGTSAADTVNVNGGALNLGNNDRLADTAAVNVSTDGTLNLGTFTDTVNSFTLDGGTLNGAGTLTGTLTAMTYTLKGGTVNANLGTGTLNQTSNTTILNGASLAHMVNVNGGNLALGASERLADFAAVTVSTNGTLNLGIFDDTVGTFSLDGGTLDGTGTLTTTTLAYNLQGGTVNANLGAGILNQTSNTTTLNGASNAGTVNVNGGSLALGANERLNDTAAVTVSSGTLNLAGKTDTIGTLQGGGQVSLDGGALTVGNGDGSSTFDGAISGAGSLTKAGSGTFILNGTSAADAVNVNGGSLALGADERLNDTAAVTVSSGTLNLAGKTETIGTLQGGGQVSLGGGALTVGNGDGSSTFDGAISGAGSLTKAGSGTFTLNGTSAADTVNVNGGNLTLGDNERLTNDAAVTIATNGTLNLGTFTDTVASFTLNGGTLDGTGTLTTTNHTYTLKGGTVNANLGTGTLNQTSNTTTLNGASNAGTVNVNGGSLTLGDNERLTNDAAVTVTTNGTLNLGTFDDTVGTFSLDGGTLDGTGTLTAMTYTLKGGTVNANLGAGILNQTSNTTTLNGASNAGTVNVNGGSLALGDNERLNDTAAVTVSSGTLNLAGKTETIGTLQGGGQVSLDGGALTVGNGGGSSTFDGAISGAGSLTKAGSGTFTLNGTSSAGTVNVNGGALALGNDERLNDTAAVTVATGGVFNLAGTTETIGTLQGSGQVNLGGGALTVGNGGESSTFDGAISGAGSLTKAGSGTLALTGNNTHTGGIKLHGGVVVAADDTALGDAAASLVFDGGTLRAGGNFTTDRTLVFETGNGTIDTAEFTVAVTGDISGDGGLIKTGSGTLELTGQQGHAFTELHEGILRVGLNESLGAPSAQIFVLGGTLQSTDSFSADRIVDISQGSTFTVDTNGKAVTMSGNIGGTGGLNKTGIGTLTLTGNNTYTGDTRIQAGQLSVKGTINSNVNVASGAILRGTGTINGQTTVQGTLSPGNSPGILTFNASVIQAPGSTLEIEIDGPEPGTGHSQVRVIGAGNDFTADGTLAPILRDESRGLSPTFTAQLTDQFTIVDVELGTVLGEFDTLTQPAAGLAAGTRFDTLYTDNNVILVVTPESFAEFGQRENGIAAGGAFDTVRPAAGRRGTADSAELLAGLAGLNAGQLAESLQDLSGEIHANVLETQLAAGRQTRNVVLSRLSALRAGQPQLLQTAPVAQSDQFGPLGDLAEAAHRQAGDGRVWVQGFGTFAQIDDDSTARDYDQQISGVVVGGDLSFGSGLVAGVAVAAINGDVDADTSGDGDIDSTQALAYGSWTTGPLFVDATLAHGWDEYTTDRTVRLSSGATPLSGKADGESWAADLAVGAKTTAFGMQLEPTVGVRWDRIERDGFTESGSGAVALAVDDTTLNRTQLRAGTRATTAVQAGKATVTPEVRLFVLHDLDGDHPASTSVTLQGAPFTVSAADPGATALAAGAGVSVGLSRSLQLYVDYDAELRKNQVGHSVVGGLRLTW